MLVQGVPLSKSPEAHFTFKGFRASVDSVVMFQVLLRSKTLAACLTHERPLTCVAPFVINQHVVLGESCATLITDKRFFPGVDSHVGLER